jgi:hypothetical protein
MMGSNNRKGRLPWLTRSVTNSGAMKLVLE